MGYPQNPPVNAPPNPMGMARREATNDYAALFVALIGGCTLLPRSRAKLCSLHRLAG